MDSETRHLDSARVPAGIVPPEPPTPGAAPGPGTPTTYLPPVGAAPQAGPVYATPPQAGSAPVPPTPQVGTTYEAPGPRPAPSSPQYQAAAGSCQSPVWSRAGRSPHGWLPLILIALGIWAVFGRFHFVFGAAIPLALGLIFLYVSTQGPSRWGFRIPGAILTGLGAGIVLDTMNMGMGGGYSAVGLGLGFIALWAWERTQWWWLIPGSIITLGGLQGVMSSSGWSENFLFPLALLAFGAYLLRGRQWRARRP